MSSVAAVAPPSLKAIVPWMCTPKSPPSPRHASSPRATAANLDAPMRSGPASPRAVGPAATGALGLEARANFAGPSCQPRADVPDAVSQRAGKSPQVPFLPDL